MGAQTNGRRRVTLDFYDWPREDRVAWRAYCQVPKGLFDPAGPGALVAPATRQNWQKSYGRWLFHLRAQDPEALRMAPIDRMTPEAITAFALDAANHLCAIALSCTLSHLANFARFMAPDRDWGWFQTIRRKMMSLGRRQSRQKPSVDIRTLYRIGIDLMDHALNSRERYPQRYMLAYRDGLTIALLAVCPIRLNNFTGLRIGETFLRNGQEYRIEFDGREVKNRRRLAMPVPAVLTPYIETYLSCVRPQLADSSETASLLVTKDGAPMPGWSLAKQIKARTRKALGFPINPHLFRHSAATATALELPQGTRVAQVLLGHADIRTTDQYYVLSARIQAANRLHKTLQSRQRMLKVKKDE